MRELTKQEKKVLDELRHTEADGFRTGFAKHLSYSMLERGFIAGLDHQRLAIPPGDAAEEVERLRAALDDALAKEEESQVQSGEYAAEVLELRAENTTLEIERDEVRAENDRLRAAVSVWKRAAKRYRKLAADTPGKRWR